MSSAEDFLARWRLISSEGFDEYIKELGVNMAMRKMGSMAKPCEGFDEYIKELGVNMAMRKMGSMAKPDIIISKEGDTIRVKTESTFKTHEFSFKLGEKFEENTIDGQKTQTLITLDDHNTLTQNQEWDGKETTITRKLIDGQMVMECVMNAVKCTVNLSESMKTLASILGQC